MNKGDDLIENLSKYVNIKAINTGENNSSTYTDVVYGS